MKKKRTNRKQQRNGRQPQALPSAANWVPREKAATTLASAFAKRCASGEESLRRMLQQERDLAVDNFDSGLPFEAAVREELARLVPRRYEVTHGVLVDRNGFTAGQCDVVIFNHIWFTAVNAPTLAQPARLLIPVEGAYAIGEVKQTLSVATLDAAMEKLVTCHRLHRPPTYAHRIVENRESGPCEHGLTNPLFSFILAGDVDGGDLQPLIERFFDINRQLRRLEVVRCLCVLGKGAVTWAFRDPLRNDEVRPALFMEGDLFHPIVPAYAPVDVRPPLFSLLQTLHLHLFHSVLAPEDIVTAYGDAASFGIALPTQPHVALPPDKDWVRRLEKPCRTRGEADE
ncbi:DUF6602 domain-containing protein [Sorangium sp. So ce1014]|uniref:DUF6602 domain-containing protein n=1 Tax=Sorangium sp. So ce1014 TaxID=3133326 RepID=UPI003F5E25D3